MRKITQTIVGTTPPLDKNVMWLDTTNNEPIQKIFLNGEWRPLKDADIDAEFESGQKVSDIALDTSSGTSSNNSKIPTVAKLNETLSGYHERAAYTHATITEGAVKIEYNTSTNANYVVGNTATSITLAKASGDPVDSVTTIRFTSGSPAITIEYTEGELLWAGDEKPEIEANAEYIIAIWNCIGVISKIDTIENS